MNTLEEIKDEVSKEYGYVNFKNLIEACPFPNLIMPSLDEIAQRYAAQAFEQGCKEQRVRCALVPIHSENKDIDNPLPEDMLMHKSILNIPLVENPFK